MQISIDAVKVAEELADNDKLYKSLRKSKIYVENVRNSSEWQHRYDYYFEILTNNADIKK